MEGKQTHQLRCSISANQNKAKIFRYLQEHEKLRYKHSEKGWAKNIEEALEKAKLALKEAFQLDTFFEKLGIVYLGPFDGTTWSLCL